MKQHTRPETPLLAVDIIIEIQPETAQANAPMHAPIVLIQRKNPPLGWALPGGFVDIGESVEHAACREALEETCLTVNLESLLGVYSDPGRDQRGHTVGIVYIATACGVPRAADDAAAVQLIDANNPPTPLAFDHQQIINDYLNYRDNGDLPSV